MHNLKFRFTDLFSQNYWILRKYRPLVLAIENQYAKLVNHKRLELLIKANELKTQINQQPAEKRSQNQFLIAAFALAMAAIKHVLNIKLHSVQIYGALALHYGNVAEMKTGEGKTLTAILPAFFNSLLNNKVYIVTVNEYLVERDAKNNAPIFNLLGLEVGFILASMDSNAKFTTYKNPIIYITNSEIGFDYLRDNMRTLLDAKMQESLDYVIVDEVDSILIDEGRTPLIISGKEINRTNLYLKVNNFVDRLRPTDYKIDREHKQIFLITSGILKAQTFFKIDNLFDLENSELFHFINNALYAHKLLIKNIDYIVKNKQILLIDHFTGRILEGRSLSEGLHQALEAKESLAIKKETSILASITYQNFFRLFKKIAGMTGTAKSEADELREVYNMEVIQIPTNKPIIRHDENDKIFYNDTYKFTHLIDDIKNRHAKGQPVLIGTNALEVSETIAKFLTRIQLPFKLLNAKHHEYEAKIIANAGKSKAITIATNMAGRGTDIRLEEAAKNAGGLAVLGVARNDSRRIDLQLRGRSGRQGEPGYSCFYISLDDVLFQRFGKIGLKRIFASLKTLPLQSGILNRTIKRAQKQLTNSSYEQRKNILEYDNIISQQRAIIYLKREKIFKIENFLEYWTHLINDFIQYRFHLFSLRHFHFNRQNIEKFRLELVELGILNDTELLLTETNFHDWTAVLRYFSNYLIHVFAGLNSEQQTFFVPPIKMVMLRILDELWSHYLIESSKIKAVVFLQSYAQKQPLQTFIEQTEVMYQNLKIKLQENTIKKIKNWIHNYLN